MGSSAINALIAADVTFAEAHPTPYSLSLFPGANGEAFGAGQAFSGAIPEPGTWAMMLLGFAGLGFAGWRRTRPKLSIVE
jgi:PEP-CTERM motif